MGRQGGVGGEGDVEDRKEGVGGGWGSVGGHAQRQLCGKV